MFGGPMSPLLWQSSGASPDKQALAVWCAYTGQDKKAAQGWGWLEAVHPADRASVRATWEQAAQTQNVFALTYRICHIGGEYHPFRVLGVPLFDDAHQLQGWFVFFGEEPERTQIVDEHWELRLINSMIYSQVVLGIFCLSLDGSVLRVNNHLCELTGYTEGELLGMTLWQLSMPEDIHTQLRAMRERLSSSKSYPPFRIRYRCKDGTLIWLRITQFLVRMPTGEPYYFFYVAEDIRNRVKSEEERAELLARLQETHAESLARTRQLETIFESMTDGILVTDSTGQVIRSNTALHSVMHLDQYPGFLQMPLKPRLALLQAANEQGQPFCEEDWPLARLLRGESLHAGNAVEMRLVLPDSQTIYLSFSGSPLRDQHEQVVGAVLVVSDVTERRLIEKRVQKSFGILLALAEELMHIPETRGVTPAAESVVPAFLPFRKVGQHLVELVKQMLEYQGASISLLDAEDGQFHMIAISGHSEAAKAIYYRNFGTFAPSDFLDEPTICALRENEVVIREIILRARRDLPVTLLLAPMLLDGRLVGVLSIKKAHPYAASYSREEISLVKAVAKLVLLVIERERAQQEWIESHASEVALREANRRFDEFLSIASHELRTPLAGIKGNVQLALRRLSAIMKDLPEADVLCEKLEKVQEYLLHAEQRVNVQNRMIGDLLDVSRIQANKLELFMQPCNLTQVVGEAVEDQRSAHPERAILLTTDEEAMVLGDADRLSQVVHNYLTNALKYAPADQPIEVRLETREDAARVSVRDKGPGLSPEEQKRVWKRFYRVKHIPAQNEGAPSMGLGLYLCRKIIEAHQGDFGLESTPGHGSTFWFTLPPLQCAPAMPEQQSFTLQEHAPGG